ncbi:hydantoinase/oxoprolinase family protein [Kaistia dalseonensis]|uniref:N-methylhydantoinase A n=1 Tax=Kaistia dalseonensis TaxID=410840 RepID=A0ABU0H835_9HYPH|nr:hydantoinase/oxoprolinase family protein [Kaistia dalseonensis]MCX5495869.1 hydantoinase/oxoprolinase family protein [Kaistia dalseonensis]MDQ0438470.1 N-methylhydantoinase A [Kaistia dalseonensis]
MATRIGVDIGGTFTDLVYYDDETGETVEGKVPTVPHAPEEGVVNAVKGHVPREVIEKAEFFLHGTTVGLNALLERRGAKVGLITTEGFRDVLEIRRGDRAEMYNLFWKQPEPLVPRHRRLEVVERIKADGSVYRPLDEASVAPALAALVAEGVDTIAVCLINAYANPAHELRVEELLRAGGFTGGISLSHKISGEYREYERTSTTVIDAFVRARMSNYLKRLDGRLRELGFKGTSLITRSGSGSMTFAEAEDRPFETIMSGPVAGAQGASEVAQMLGIEALITADVGGTSFDAALILNGQPQVLYEGTIDNMPIQTPWVDVRSIGSGGGSIAHIDVGGLMRVGPRSAGAAPGPACYGKGGTEPAMTDAAGYLGMLGPGKLASGITLDFEKARAAIEPVAAAIRQDVETTAIGILRIASSSMANAMREVSVEQGLDPRTMTLLPFGGAGPLMATLLADELKMNRIVVPPLAGNFSAWGLLGADMVQSAARTRIMDLSPESIETVNAVLRDLFADIATRGDHLSRETVKTARIDLRYKGQEHWLSIEVPLDGETVAESAEGVRAAFTAEYLRSFGGTMTEAVEIVSIRATVRAPLPRRNQTLKPPEVSTEAEESVLAYSFGCRKRMPFRVVPRSAIVEPLQGPAIVTESTATLYLDADWTASTGDRGELVLVRSEAN